MLRPAPATPTAAKVKCTIAGTTDSGEGCGHLVANEESLGPCIDANDRACFGGQFCDVPARACRRIAGVCGNGSCGRDELCAQQCDDDADCADFGAPGARCEGLVKEFSLLGEEFTEVVGLCVQRIGAANACQRDADCPPESPRCTATTDLEGNVRPPVPDPIANFAACDDTFDDLACLSGVCDGGACRPLCATDDDCVVGSCGLAPNAVGPGQGILVCQGG